MKNSAAIRLFVLIAILAAASLACEMGNAKTSNGERVVFNDQGFSFVPPVGTTVSNMGILGADITAANPDKNGEQVLGPTCTADTTTHHFDIKESTKNYWTDAIASEKNAVGLDLGAYQESSVSGHFAIEGDETGAYVAGVDTNNTPIFGKRLDIQLDGKQVLILSCEGPVTRKDETIRLYLSLKSSLQLFSPITSTPVK